MVALGELAQYKLLRGGVRDCVLYPSVAGGIIMLLELQKRQLVQKDELDGLLGILHDGDVERFEATLREREATVREREERRVQYHAMPMQPAERPAAIEMNDLQQNGSLEAALVEAARAHTEAAAASQAVAREMERLQSRGIAITWYVFKMLTIR